MAVYNPPYTPEEQKKIVEYIIEHDAFHMIKGDRLWKNMEKETIVGRTWQSMKQHFRKKIIHELHYPRYNLSLETVENFYKYFNKIDITRKYATRKKKMNKQKEYPKLTLMLSPTRDDSSSDESGLNLNEETNQINVSSENKKWSVPSNTPLALASTSSFPKFTFDTSSSSDEQEDSVICIDFEGPECIIID